MLGREESCNKESVQKAHLDEECLVEEEGGGRGRLGEVRLGGWANLVGSIQCKGQSR